MARFFVVFIALLAVLFGLELTPVVQAFFVVPWTNALAAISAVDSSRCSIRTSSPPAR